MVAHPRYLRLEAASISTKDGTHSYDGQPVDPTNWTHPPFEPTFYTAAMEAGGEPQMFPEEGEAVRCPVKELHMNRPLAMSDGVTLPAGST